jgi:hypothetical protein
MFVMQSTEIDAWARSVIQRVRSGLSNEDRRVELKREWPTAHERAARQLAAHANSALGEPILWIVGVDQKTGDIHECSQDLANWWPAVQAHFDGPAPELVDHVLDIEGRAVVAICFTTEARPFVVRSKPDFLEVPWREGTRTRSAKRSELIRLLRPIVELPEFEIHSGELTIQEIRSEPKPIVQLTGMLIIYVLPKRDGRLVFPFHRALCVAHIAGEAIRLPQLVLQGLMSPAAAAYGFGNVSTTIHASTTELIVTGPGSFRMRARVAIEEKLNLADSVTLEARLAPAGGNTTAVLKLALSNTGSAGGNLAVYR